MMGGYLVGLQGFCLISRCNEEAETLELDG